MNQGRTGCAKRRLLASVPAIVLLMLAAACGEVLAEPLVYEGAAGPGKGKHIVLLAGDHEYRSEESLPALARILSRHHGFRCTVLFTVDPDSGVIVPGCNNIPGLAALQDADLMVVFLRFQDLPDDQMQHIVDYLDRAGPVLGLRTSTHAFKIPKTKTFAKYDYRFGGDYKGGFGRQVLGETWAGHYGKNHVMSTRLDVVKPEHPILRGVARAWVQSGGYWTEPTPDSEVLTLAQPLQGMTPTSPPAEGKEPCPGAWVRTYTGESGKKGRVFTSTYGASEDLLDDGYRRLLVNAVFWCAGLEDKVRPDLKIDLVGPYHPTTFRFNGYRQNVLPGELAGWDSPIMPPDKPVAPPRKRRPKR